MSAIRLGTLRLPAAFVLGLLFSQAFSPGILWGLLGAAALFAQLQLIVAAHRCREAALIAFCFGLGWFGAGLSWTMESMHAHGGLPTWAAAVGLALLAAVCSAFGATAAAAARRAVRRPLFAPFAYASVLILAEYLRAGGGLDFGWLNPGAAAVDLPWAGWAPVAGSIGVAVAYLFSLAAVSSAFYAWREGRRLGSVVLLSAAVMSAGGGQLGRFCAWSTSGPTVAMSILQTNQPVVDAFTQTSAADRIEEAARILEGDSAEKDRTDLALTPEGILPGDLASAARSASHALEHFLKSARGPVLFSGFWQEDDGRWFNSAFYADGRSFGRVDKRKLVPFGEFVPKGFRWFVDLMGIPLSDLSEGRMDQALFRAADRKFGVMICYEALDGEVLRSFWRGAEGPDFLVASANLGWFSPKILGQYLQLARMRAMESARPVASASATGLSALIDAKGRVLAFLPAAESGVLHADVVTALGAPTPYVRFGDLPALTLAFLLGLAACAADRRAREPRSIM